MLRLSLPGIFLCMTLIVLFWENFLSLLRILGELFFYRCCELWLEKPEKIGGWVGWVKRLWWLWLTPFEIWTRAFVLVNLTTRVMKWNCLLKGYFSPFSVVKFRIYLNMRCCHLPQRTCYRIVLSEWIPFLLPDTQLNFLAFSYKRSQLPCLSHLFGSYSVLFLLLRGSVDGFNVTPIVIGNQFAAWITKHMTLALSFCNFE